MKNCDRGWVKCDRCAASVKCDVCGDDVSNAKGEPDFDSHNKENYVRHVFLSHPREEDRIRILQSYVNRG